MKSGIENFLYNILQEVLILFRSDNNNDNLTQGHACFAARRIVFFPVLCLYKPIARIVSAYVDYVSLSIRQQTSKQNEVMYLLKSLFQNLTYGVLQTVCVFCVLATVLRSR
jgi:hypothetical protein